MTDGTEEGTQLFADLNPGELRSSPQTFKVAFHHLFFVSIVPDDALYRADPALDDRRHECRHAHGL